MPQLDPLVPAVAAAAFAVLFAAAAVHKLRDFGRFHAALEGYRLLPVQLTVPAAMLVIAVEAGIAVACLFPALRSGALVAGAALLAVYAGAMSVNLLRGRDRIDCGCLGFDRAERIEWWMVRRNLLIAAVATVIAVLPSTQRPLGALDGLVVAFAVLTAALLYLAHATLASNRRHLAR